MLNSKRKLLCKIIKENKAKRHNKSEKLFGYPQRYPKCDIRNIYLRNPKHYVFPFFLSCFQVRGLEFIFGEAIDKGYTSICSAGTSQSNCVRTVALMASSLGMPSHFVIYSDKVRLCRFSTDCSKYY